MHPFSRRQHKHTHTQRDVGVLENEKRSTAEEFVKEGSILLGVGGGVVWALRVRANPEFET